MEARGLPLLSGPPPATNDSSRSESGCRKCGSQFNLLFSRSKKCNHCGYLYCNSCTDYQALMPRAGDESGYVVMPVCGYCIDFLTVTAGGKNFLRSLPLSRLRKYLEAYNVQIDRVVEKDDLINGILAAKGPNGCLPPANEEYYRRNSVPNQRRSPNARQRNMFSRSNAAPQSDQSRPPPPPPSNRPPMYNFPRPDLVPDTSPPSPPQPQMTPPSPPPPVPPRPSWSTQSAPPPSTPPPPPRFASFFETQTHFAPPSQPPPQWVHTPPSPPLPPSPPPRPPPPPMNRPSPQPRSVTPTPPPPTHTPSPSTSIPPTLDDLLQMSAERIPALSISALKSILHTNHVNAGMVLEKGDLVHKVQRLVDEERMNRERQRAVEEAEELERLEREREQELLGEENHRRHQQHPEREHHHDHTAHDRTSFQPEKPSGDSPTPQQTPPAKPGAPSPLERDGICVVCYDNEANIAIVDCGHLAMCRGCSDLIMESSRECPLCRTRIVTEARLLRIFRT